MDYSGNQQHWADKSGNIRRTIVWDEENRVQFIKDRGAVTGGSGGPSSGAGGVDQVYSYKYDHAGQRRVKRGPNGWTNYVNQFYTDHNGTIPTKHIFAGSTRIVSRMNYRNVTGNAKKVEFYYHPDHLGSTNYVTDEKGDLYEHVEYMPFGESWVSERKDTVYNGLKPQYLFTSKELDQETGLIYHGARYYDPRTSVWQSPDPILVTYLDGKPNYGVLHAPNLNLYAYTYQNPVRYIDPDGRITRDLQGGEEPLARTVFGDSIDYNKVKISSGNIIGPLVLGGEILFKDRDYAFDFSNWLLPGKLWNRKTFMHEMTHIWQDQNGMNTTLRWVGWQLISWNPIGIVLWLLEGILTGDWNTAYDNSYYSFMNLPIDTPFKEYSMESQATIVELYQEALDDGYIPHSKRLWDTDIEDAAKFKKNKLSGSDKKSKRMKRAVEIMDPRPGTGRTKPNFENIKQG